MTNRWEQTETGWVVCKQAVVMSSRLDIVKKKKRIDRRALPVHLSELKKDKSKLKKIVDPNRTYTQKKMKIDK